jgi:hypothetical protein
MATITVRVKRDGQPVKDCEVSLGEGGLGGGVHGPEYTDYGGVARFSVHDGTGGDVFVNHQRVAHWGTSSATDIAVHI